ncbi:MAG: hypothetical protein D6830_07070 [Ignavibacteria bacterium]|nr:MAG: hypothetical protein D6830_07070 [Ignavibacteria bacterium]
MKSDETLLRAFVVKIREMKNQLNNHLENIKIEVKTVGKNNIKLNAVQSLNIFRIIEEAIQNSVKYSGGDKIIIKFNLFPEGFELTVKDNGCGFDPKKIKSGEGLHNMQFRCEEAGGIFKINSGQRGTEIKCRFTINNTNAV